MKEIASTDTPPGGEPTERGFYQYRGVSGDNSLSFAPKMEGGPLPGSGKDLTRVLSELEHAAEFLKSRYLEGLIEQAIFAAVQRAQSPWLDRAGAAAYCACSTSELDRAAKRKVFKTYLRGGTPLFLRQELDAVIEDGLWPGRKTKAADAA